MFKFLMVSAMLIIFAACGNDHSPRPRGFFRIDLPEKQYQRFEADFPYSFEHPVYSNFLPDTRTVAEPYWGNLEFPRFKAVVYLSYKPVGSASDLISYTEDARTFVNKHIPKATAIDPQLIMIPRNNVYGMYYDIKGREAASPVQFWVTDSVDHFLRGALYFNVTPNNDSLAPVIDFLQEDLLQLISTLNWHNP